MGSYSVLCIGDLSLRLRAADKNDVNPTVLVLFDETDKRVREFTEDDYLYEPQEQIVTYAISLEIAKDRLEFMGFTMPTIKRIFQEGREEHIAELEKRRADPRWTTKDHMKNYIDMEEKVWEELTFETWLNGFAYIITNRLELDKRYRQWLDDSSSFNELPRTIFYMLDQTFNGLLGFPSSYDHRPFIRAAIEMIGTDAELIYDLTDLVASKYFEAHEDFCADARWRMSEDPAIQKIVVLTEGKSDKWVLEGSLRLLYPHLAGYYSFMDFDSARVAGSASELVKTVKAFIGAGISNRIIALFDNDTAAQSAMRALKKVKVPKNVRILRYPDIQIAQSYPTLRPQGQGLVIMDVNGLASSLELYFGRDVLVDASGSLTPVEWGGYDEALQQYQGEVLNKAKLQEKFKDKLRDCQKDRSIINKYNWDGMQAIIELLKTAFHE